MVAPEVITGVTASLLTSWFADQIPRPGEPLGVVEKKIRNIVLAAITSIGVAYIVTQVVKPEVKKSPFTTEERFVMPGYYE